MIRTSHQAVAWAGVSLLFTMVAILAFSASAFADDGDGYAPGWEPISSELSTDVDPDELMARVEAGQSDVSGATVFGFDDRIPVEDTTAAPWRTIAHLYIALPGGGYGECTGTFVAPNAVITAAHCLYDDEYGDFVDSILVIPGETAFDEPFGTALASYVRVPVGWTETGSFYYDFGLITLDDDPFFGALGPYYMKIGATPDSMFANPGENVIATAGYPGDKPLGSMWFTGDFGYTYDDDYLYTQMDAYPGQSGSPVFVMDYEGDELADVYIGGIFSFETPSFNGARRLTQIIVDALVDWCAEDGCTINVQQYEDDPAPTVTATPSPTATSTPTPTASPTATPTATSTPTLPPAADGTYTYDLSFRWNLYTWYGVDGTAPEQAVSGQGPAAGGSDVFDIVTAIYGSDGGQQRWLGFFPDAIGIPGANDLLALGFGDAYWIATNESGGATWTIPSDDAFDGEPQPSPTETPTPPPTATATPTATPSPTPAPVSFGPGTYVIGVDIPAGTYVAENANDACYWERLSGFSGDFDDIIANDFGDTRPIVTISPTDAGFYGDTDCGVWTAVTDGGTPATSFGAGTWRVGIEIEPGTYRATGANDACYWERLSGFGGRLGDIIDNDFGNPSPIVTILPSDVGFSADTDCGTWSKIG